MAISEIKVEIRKRWFADVAIYACMVAAYYGADADNLAKWCSDHCFKFEVV